MHGLWEKAYVLLVAAEIDLALLALVAETGNVVGQVQARAFLGEDSGGECSRAGHVQVADLVAAAREVAQSDKLDGSGSCHFGGMKDCVFGLA